MHLLLVVSLVVAVLLLAVAGGLVLYTRLARRTDPATKREVGSAALLSEFAIDDEDADEPVGGSADEEEEVDLTGDQLAE